MTLAYFMKALSDKDAARLTHYAKLMAGNKVDLSTGQEKDLIEKVNRIVQEKNLSESLQDVVVEIYRAGIKLEQRFSFGALKGFMTLYGQGYVSGDRFVELLKESIKPLAIKKAPVVTLARQ